jgi:hypothetical protein
MREKIIAVFAVVVLIVALLSFALMRATLGDVSNQGESQRAVTSAVAQLEVEALRIERWLDAEAGGPEVRRPFDAGTPEARADEARKVADAIESRAKGSTAFRTIKPSIVALCDQKGVVLGRNGSQLMRGAKLGERYPRLVETIGAGNTGSDLWVSKAHNERLLASYAPVRDAAGQVIGGLVVGTPLNDERLQNTSETTSQVPLVIALREGEQMTPIAKSARVTDVMLGAVASSSQAVGSDQVVALAGLTEDLLGSAKALAGYGDGRQAVVMAVTPARLVGSFWQLLWPALGAVLLGLILTAVGAHLIDAYISRPISDLEDGLLAIINGQQDIRFELEHVVLGGLVFRINSLLNQLLGVREDDTDEEGRPSHAPSSQSFTAALNVDERMASMNASDVEGAKRLKDEAPEDYYKRIYDEYISANRDLGNPVDHLKFAPFVQRIKAGEQELTDKHGKPFRYKLEVAGREIVFIAVPLS